MRLRGRSFSDAGRKPVRFAFNGAPMEAFAGETIAAALAANGISEFRQTPVGPRGLYCGMGACFDCLVTVDGRGSQRACMTTLQGGETVDSAPSVAAPLAERPEADLPETETDVLVIGAGPAGLAAGRAARRRGARVIVLDDRKTPGGQFYKQPAASLGDAPRRDRQSRAGATLAAEARAAGVEILSDAEVFGAFAADEIAAMVEGRARVFRPRRLILATGAYERPAPFPGWTLPGVMTTGAAQTLLRAYGVAPGRRIAIAGAGPLNFQLAAELTRAGAEVVALAEAARRPSVRNLAALAQAWAASPRLMADGVRYLARLMAAGAPVLWGMAAARAERQENSALGVMLAPIDREGRLDHTAARRVEADALCVGYGFMPSAEIARALGCALRYDDRHLGALAVETGEEGETTLPGVFAIGDGAAPAGAPLAEIAGEIAGDAAARQLGFAGVGSDVPRLLRRRARARRFQQALWTLFDAPRPRLAEVDDATTLCRCEGVSFGRIRAEIAAGWRTPGAIKRRTRCGMGRCQGRYCAATLARLLEETTGRARGPEESFAPRNPVKPFPVIALAREKPEWGGHARAGTPDLSRAEAAEPFATQEVEIAIIGAGIVGSCLAYYLAEAGREVLVLDRDEVNLQASGGNAGSLHTQLLSFDFGAKAEAGGSPAVATLPLGPWSVELWRALAREAETRVPGADFEIRVTGGLMAAESEAGMAFLRAKAAVERANGVEAEIIGRAELRDLAPGLSERLIGADYAPQEGKINPLTATYAVWRMAQSHGARIERWADVRALERKGAGWEIETARGRVRAGTVINAAGPWARPVAALAGVDAPVFSAPLQMIVTEPAPKLVDQLVAHADRHLSLKQLAAGGLVIGGAWTAAYSERQRLNVTTRASLEGNLWVAERVLPALSGLHVVRSWAAMNVNIDGAPIIGEAPNAPGFYLAVTSNGYTLAPAIARLAADLILSGEARRDVRPYALDRFNGSRAA